MGCHNVMAWHYLLATAMDGLPWCHGARAMVPGARGQGPWCQGPGARGQGPGLVRDGASE